MTSYCDCPCGLVHPQARDVCAVAEPVTTRTVYNTRIEQLVPVPLCRACADLLDALRAEFGKPPIRKEGTTK